ncbi:MAG: hypothetical protein QOE55_5053, partial [Acidobacteriaceae bacterium]|nr:hypothetical protein [Acidobacteriaceae bacterium]
MLQKQPKVLPLHLFISRRIQKVKAMPPDIERSACAK